jgi:hypothetical protein
MSGAKLVHVSVVMRHHKVCVLYVTVTPLSNVGGRWLPYRQKVHTFPHDH